MRDDLAETLEQDGNVYSTYGWHPLSVDVAIVNVRWIKRNQDRLLRQVERTAAYFVERIRAMAFPEEAEIRWRGLAIAVDVRDDNYARGCRHNRAGLPNARVSIVVADGAACVTPLPRVTVASIPPRREPAVRA